LRISNITKEAYAQSVTPLKETELEARNTEAFRHPNSINNYWGERVLSQSFLGLRVGILFVPEEEHEILVESDLDLSA
jgi:hypothetical protein